jgi:hypothetical protein
MTTTASHTTRSAVLTCSEQGVPHASHQPHIIEAADGYIAAVRMFCGGRCEASLFAQMGAADASV